jgi:predicted amidophosphoribosyltransferase
MSSCSTCGAPVAGSKNCLPCFRKGAALKIICPICGGRKSYGTSTCRRCRAVKQAKERLDS